MWTMTLYRRQECSITTPRKLSLLQACFYFNKSRLKSRKLMGDKTLKEIEKTVILLQAVVNVFEILHDINESCSLISSNRAAVRLTPYFIKIIGQGRLDCFAKMEGSPSSQTLEESTEVILKVAQASQSLKDHEEQVIYCTQALENLEDPVEQLKQCTQVDFKEQKPEWLESFLKRTFFESCPIHPFRRNELNKYCIDCDASLCQYCLSPGSHEYHRLLKIYRHVYKDVVPLDEIERHVDCSQIQPYRCNKQQVIALSPLPHSGPKTNEEVTCQTCKRKLIEYIYSYCSISCKVEEFPKTKNGPPPPPDQPGKKENEEPKSKRTRRRKGIPHRAPFF